MTDRRAVVWMATVALLAAIVAYFDARRVLRSGHPEDEEFSVRVLRALTDAGTALLTGATTVIVQLMDAGWRLWKCICARLQS